MTEQEKNEIKQLTSEVAALTEQLKDVYDLLRGTFGQAGLVRQFELTQARIDEVEEWQARATPAVEFYNGLRGKAVYAVIWLLTFYVINNGSGGPLNDLITGMFR